jgi:hypothetical protein
MIEIKNRWTGRTIVADAEAETLRDAVIRAVANRTNLSAANLRARLVSRVSRPYGGGSFKIRGVTYEMMKDGSLRAHGKPRSRVKRLHEQRLAA